MVCRSRIFECYAISGSKNRTNCIFRVSDSFWLCMGLYCHYPRFRYWEFYVERGWDHGAGKCCYSGSRVNVMYIRLTQISWNKASLKVPIVLLNGESAGDSEPLSTGFVLGNYHLRKKIKKCWVSFRIGVSPLDYHESLLRIYVILHALKKQIENKYI